MDTAPFNYFIVDKVPICIWKIFLSSAIIMMHVV